MRTRTILASATAFFLGTVLAFAADANMGTWKLNEAKTKLPAGAPKNTTVIYSAAGDMIKITTDGVDKDGKPTHTEWTGKYDGKDYPATGAAASGTTRSYTKVDDHTLQFDVKNDGKVMTNGRVVVSADGKSRTVTTTTKEASGEETKLTAVYDKQ